MTDETAEKAYRLWSGTKFERPATHQAFLAGRASRDAEVAEGHERRMRQFYMIQELREQMAATEAVRDAALQALSESRARFGDMEQRALATEAVITKAAETIKTMSVLEAGPSYGIRLPLGEIEKVQAVLSESPSSVLDALIREKQAEALDDLARKSNSWDGEWLHKVADAYRNGGK